jgi:hypothetical protein
VFAVRGAAAIPADEQFVSASINRDEQIEGSAQFSLA